MQNRYVGDVGDFGKYALLRQICGGLVHGKPQLGFVWFLFPDEGHNDDGRHITYLQKSGYRELDPLLFDQLRTIIEAGDRRIRAISESGVLPESTIYFEQPTIEYGLSPKARAEYREAWLQQALSETSNADIVFLDPDNGVEAKSVNKRNIKAGKYVFWDEIEAFTKRGQSLVVYHHLNRTASSTAQISKLSEEFKHRLSREYSARPLIFRRGSCRVFWLLLHHALAGYVYSRVENMLNTGWKQHFNAPDFESVYS